MVRVYNCELKRLRPVSTKYSHLEDLDGKEKRGLRSTKTKAASFILPLAIVESIALVSVDTRGPAT